MNFKVSKKNGAGKWWSCGRIKKNEWGNLQLSFKKTPELAALFQGDGYINFSLFPDEDQPQQPAKEDRGGNVRQILEQQIGTINRPIDFSEDEIPF